MAEVTPKFHSPEVERAAHGLRVRGHALYLEPRGRPPMGFLAHARGAPAILPERMIASGPTIQLLTAALPRALRRTAALPAAYGKSFALGSLRLTLYPARARARQRRRSAARRTGWISSTPATSAAADRAPR